MVGTLTKSGEAETLTFPGEITLSILLSSAATGGTLAIFEDVVEPGVGPGRHVHHGEDETFFVNSGKFVVEVDGTLHDLRPGDVAHVPRGTVHAFKNIGTTPGSLRYAFTPAGQVEAMFRAFFEASQTGEMDLDAMSRIALDHGQEFVGPPL